MMLLQPFFALIRTSFRQGAPDVVQCLIARWQTSAIATEHGFGWHGKPSGLLPLLSPESHHGSIQPVRLIDVCPGIPGKHYEHGAHKPTCIRVVGTALGADPPQPGCGTHPQSSANQRQDVGQCVPSHVWLEQN